MRFKKNIACELYTLCDKAEESLGVRIPILFLASTQTKNFSNSMDE